MNAHTLFDALTTTLALTHMFALSYASSPPPHPPSKFTQCSMGEVVLSLFGVFVVGWSCEDNNTVGTHGHISSQRRCVKSFCRVGAVTVLFQSHDWNISCLHPSCICPVGGGGGGCPVCTDGRNLGPRGRSVDLEQVHDHSLYLFSLCVGFFSNCYCCICQNYSDCDLFLSPNPTSFNLSPLLPPSLQFIYYKDMFYLTFAFTTSYGLLVLLLIKNLKQVSSWHDFLLITCTKSQFMYLKKKIIIWFIGHKYGKIVKIHMMKIHIYPSGLLLMN